MGDILGSTDEVLTSNGCAEKILVPRGSELEEWVLLLSGGNVALSFTIKDKALTATEEEEDAVVGLPRPEELGNSENMLVRFFLAEDGC